MSKRFPVSELRELAKQYDWLQPGQTERANHNSDYCSGDSKSLKISKGRDNGNIDISCYRCGSFGRWSTVAFPKTATATKRYENTHGQPRGDSISYERPGEQITIPRNCNTKVREWGIEARRWIRLAGISDDEVEEYGICWQQYTNTVIIPISHGSELIGFQRRGFDTTYPKYITKISDKSKAYFKSKLFQGEEIVIVEDALSAIKVGRHLPAIAMLGSFIPDNAVSEIKDRKKFYIWMDNDNGKIKLKQSRLKDKLSLFGDVVVIKTDKDPKLFTDSEILTHCGRKV